MGPGGYLTIISLINLVFRFFWWVLLARIIFSFLRLGRDANSTLLQIRKLSYQLTEPVLAPIRSIVKPVSLGGGSYLDLSPIIAIILLDVVRNLLLRLLVFGFR